MSDNTQLNPGADGDIAATDDIDGVKYQRVKLTLGADGVNDGDLSAANPLPVAGSLSVDNFPAQSGLTNDQLRASSVPVVDATSAEAQQDMINLLTRMLAYLNSPAGYDKSLQRARGTVVVETGNLGTISTVTAITNLANMAAVGGIQAQLLINGQNVSAWQACVRSRIT